MAHVRETDVLDGLSPAHQLEGLTPREGKVRHLAQRPAEAKAAPQAKALPDDPETGGPPEPPRVPAAKAARSRRSLRRPLLFAVLPLALLVAGYLYVTGGTVMSTDDAYVQANMVGLSTDVSGLVREVSVHDNQQVAKGDVLFKLDDLQFRLALDRAEAQLGNTRNDLAAMQASYRNMQAQVEQAKTDVDFATVNFKRQQQLIANNFTPQATVDTSRNTLQGTQQKLASLSQQLAG